MKLIRGTRGNDVLIGTDEDERIEGSGGHDTVHAGGGDDWIYGGSGNDQVFAGAGNNRVFGESGDDIILGGLGRDTLDGGSGKDFVSLDRSTATGAIHFSLANPSSMQTLDNGTTAVNFEHGFLRSGSGNDRLIGGRYDDYFHGSGGDDWIEGGGGDDHLYGDAGNDSLYGGDGADRLEAGDGNDVIVGARGDRIIDGGAGNDIASLQFEASRANLSFSIGDNLAGTVLLEDTEVRGFERLVFEAGSGNDTIAGGDLFDILRGGGGDDSLYGGGGDDWLYGDGGDDRLFAGEGNNILGGGSGDDILLGGLGRDTMDGGSGKDFVSLDRATATGAIHFSLANPSSMQTLDNGTTAVNFEAAFLRAGLGNDQLIGGRYDDYFHGSAGDDWLEGGGGNDGLYGEAGNDSLYGGDGADRLEAGDGDDVVVGARGDRIIDGGAGNDIASLQFEASRANLSFSIGDNLAGTVLLEGTEVRGFERIAFDSGSGDDTVTGGDFFDILRGGGGDDSLYGAGGNDWIYGDGGNDRLFAGEGNNILGGGNGNDTLLGGIGRDSMDGGSGIDFASLDRSAATETIRFSFATPTVVQTLDNGTTLVNLEQGFLRAGSGHDKLTGGRYDDVFHGGAGDDWIEGGGGRDHLYGDAGNDSLYGGEGEDRLDGGEGDDLLVGGGDDRIIDGGAGNDRAKLDFGDQGRFINFSVRNSLSGTVRIGDTEIRNIEEIVFQGGRGGDLISGGEHFDVIYGGSGDDLLRGEGGDDWLHGGSGHDRLFGVAGADRLYGEGGNDFLKGEGGDDFIDGGDGTDRAAYSGRIEDYRADRMTDGSVRIVDLRSGAPDGVDVVRNVELFEFAGGTVGVGDLPTAPSNRAPEAGADTAAIGEDSGPSRIDVLANDRDPDSGDRVTIASIDTAGLAGLATLNPDGSLSYASNDKFEWLAAGQTAIDTFRYAIQDLAGFTSAASVTVTISGANDAPTARSEGFTIGNTGATALGNLLANDSDVDQGDTISLGQIAATSARGAAISIDAQGRAVYDPGDIFAGLGTGATTTDSFSYTVMDSHGAASTATVNLTINGGGVVLDPRLRITESVNEDEVTGNLYELINDAMAQFGPGTSLISIDTAGTLGTVAFDANAHVLTYAADHPSLDSLAHGDTQADTSLFYTVLTPGGDLRTGEIRMRVFGVNDSAIAVDDAVQVGEGQVINLASTLLANDLDPDSSAFQFVSVDTTGTLGRAMVNPLNGTLHYAADTPELLALDAGEMIVDHFTYTIRDLADGDHGPTSTATVTVTVTGAGPASMEFVEGGPLPLWGAQTDLLV